MLIFCCTEIDRSEWIYSASGNSRLSAGPFHKRPADNASVDFVGFRYRHASVSPALMERRRIAEENRIAELKEYCAKKGLDFDTENQKHLDKVAKKAAKKTAKKAKKAKK